MIAFAGKATPEIINSEAFDSVLRARGRLVVVSDRLLERLIELHPGKRQLRHELLFAREHWQQRNERMADHIEACARRYVGKRLVVVVVAEHRHLLRDLLRRRPGILLKEYWELQ